MYDPAGRPPDGQTLCGHCYGVFEADLDEAPYLCGECGCNVCPDCEGEDSEMTYHEIETER